MRSKTVLVLESVLSRMKRFERDLSGEYTVYFAKTVDEAIALYSEHMPGILFLNHDLGVEKTGLDFTRFLPMDPVVVPSIILYSSVGAKQMFRELQDRGYYATYNSAYPCLLAESILGAARFLTRTYKSNNEEVNATAMPSHSPDESV